MTGQTFEHQRLWAWLLERVGDVIMLHSSWVVPMRAILLPADCILKALKYKSERLDATRSHRLLRAWNRRAKVPVASKAPVVRPIKSCVSSKSPPDVSARRGARRRPEQFYIMLLPSQSKQWKELGAVNN